MNLESNLYDLDISVEKEPSKIFWSTAFGKTSIFSQYLRYFKKLKQELLMIQFINKNTLKVIPHAQDFFNGIRGAVERGISLKILWSFEHDERPLSSEQKKENSTLFNSVKDQLKDLYGLSDELPSLKTRFVHKRIPTFLDIFDRERIVFKLPDLQKPWQIFASMNVLDPNLAEKLREKFINIWVFEAIE